MSPVFYVALLPWGLSTGQEGGKQSTRTGAKKLVKKPGVTWLGMRAAGKKQDLRGQAPRQKGRVKKQI